MTWPPRGAEPLLQFRGHHDNDTDPLFVGGRPARPIKALVDSHLWERISREADIFSRTLHGLLLNEHVEVSLYSDDGPPSDAERMPADEWWVRGDEAVGWTVLKASDDPTVAYSVTVTTSTTTHSSSIFSNEVMVAQMILKREGAQGDDDLDARLIAAAQSTGVDLLITDRAHIVGSELEDQGNCRFASTSQAIALVALYLRTRGEYFFVKDRQFAYTAATAQTFFERVTDNLIPALPEFIRRAENVVEAARLVTLRRRARAIFNARDRLAVLMSVVVSADVVDEVEATFTHALVDLVAFQDVLARIVGQFLNPLCSPRVCKWQHDKWRSVALSQIPGLAPMWVDDGPSFLIDQALRGIRNEIHDLAPTFVPYRSRWGAPQVGLGLFAESGDKVAAALNSLPDDTDRGIHQRFADGYLVQPQAFFEFILPWVLQSVDSTLAALAALLPASEVEKSRSTLRPEAVAESLSYILRIRQVSAASPDSEPR